MHRRRTPLLERYHQRVRKADPDKCWPWTGSYSVAGYGTIGEGGRGGKTLYAHRIAWELVHGPIAEGLHVCHRCDNPGCVNPSHMFLGTHGENLRDMVAKGRNAHGELHGNAKLTLVDVGDIRATYAKGGVTQYDLAATYGVSRGCIEHVIQHATWRLE